METSFIRGGPAKRANPVPAWRDVRNFPERGLAVAAFHRFEIHASDADRHGICLPAAGGGISHLEALPAGDRSGRLFGLFDLGLLLRSIRTGGGDQKRNRKKWKEICIRMRTKLTAHVLLISPPRTGGVNLVKPR